MIRVLVVDDHRLFADAVGSLLEDAGMNVIASVQTGADAIGFLEDHTVDVILLDMGLPEESGLRIGKRILDRWPGMRIIAFSALEDERAIYEAIQIGFHAFVMKETPSNDLVRIVRAIGRGKPIPSLLSSLDKRLGLTARLYKLTPRERAVLGLLVEGADERTIATQLDMSKGEVKSHVQNILEKLHVYSRLAAAIKAISEVPNPSTDHPHLTPMTDDELLTHLRYMHARGIAPFSPADSDNLRELHEKLHRQPPPSSA